MSAPKALLFDWDNTLVDTWPTIHEALNHTMRAMAQPEWPMEKVKMNVKRSMREAFPDVFGERWEQAADIYQNYYRSIHLKNLRALPDAEALLQAIQTLPLFRAIVSNKKNVNLRREMDHIGWEAYFHTLVGADDAPRDKPDPAPVHLALKSSGLMPGPDVWFIGDTIIDLECAMNTGCTPILFGDVVTQGGQYQGFPFAAHARDHKDLVRLILEHAQAG